MSNKFANEILNGIWLGECNAASNRDFIIKNNIKSIINISKSCPNYFNDINYLNIPIEEHEVNIYDIINIFKVTNKYIFHQLKKGNNILIHCSKGHTRSASIIGAFIIKYLNQSFDKTINYIRKKRKNTLRDDKLMTQALYEYSLMIHKPLCYHNRHNL
jgi:protein-tyrosine phosphatase